MGETHHALDAISALASLVRGAVTWQNGGRDEYTLVVRTVTNKVLLMAGIAAVVVYVIGDLSLSPPL